MAYKKIKRKKDSVLFNLVIFREGKEKEYSVSAMPIKFLDDIVKNVKDKYG